MRQIRLRLEMQRTARELGRAQRRLAAELLAQCEDDPTWIRLGGGSAQLADLSELRAMSDSLRWSRDRLPAPGPGELAELELLFQAGGLTPREAAAVRARLRGEPHKAIAASLGIPLNHVGSHIRRGLTKLWRAVIDLHEADPAPAEDRRPS